MHYLPTERKVPSKSKKKLEPSIEKDLPKSVGVETWFVYRIKETTNWDKELGLKNIEILIVRFEFLGKLGLGLGAESEKDSDFDGFGEARVQNLKKIEILIFFGEEGFRFKFKIWNRERERERWPLLG